jgi:hypothetical protein
MKNKCDLKILTQVYISFTKHKNLLKFYVTSRASLLLLEDKRKNKKLKIKKYRFTFKSLMA